MYFRMQLSCCCKNYDSTLVSKADNKSREHNKIQKIRNNLDEVILYEALAKRMTVFFEVVMNDSEIPFFENILSN
jgi:hypothetical protein